MEIALLAMSLPYDEREFFQANTPLETPDYGLFPRTRFLVDALKAQDRVVVDVVSSNHQLARRLFPLFVKKKFE